MTTPADLRRKLQWLAALRVLVATAVLGAALTLPLTGAAASDARPLLALVGVTYALAVLWRILLAAAVRRRPLIDLQLAADVLIVSGIVAMTGGIGSYFLPLYVLPVIAAAVIELRRGGLLIAGLSAALQAGIAASQYSGAGALLPVDWLATIAPLPPAPVATFMVGLNAVAFFAVAWLTGYLAEGLRRADQRLAHASTRLADLEAFNQHVIDSLSGGLVTTDLRGRIRTFNRAAEAITGHTSAAVEGRLIQEVLQTPPEIGGALPRLLELGRSKRIEFTYERADQVRIELGMSVGPLLTAHGHAGYLFTFQDLTETKRLEREAQMQKRLAAVGQMAAGIAHEIRNPLASMTGSIQVLRSELELTDEQAQLMDIVLRESERLNDTIRNFLSYARPQRMHVQPVDVCRVLRETARLLDHSPERGPSHRLEVALADAPILVEADEAQVRQVVWNLATNGLRAMPDGGTLRLAARLEDGGEAGPFARMTVTDEGVGIAPEDLDTIFLPFRGTFANGSGLGLAIVHRIVNDYGGTIQVTSELQRGTTVEIGWPLGSGQQPAGSRQQAAGSGQSAGGGQGASGLGRQAGAQQ